MSKFIPQTDYKTVKFHGHDITVPKSVRYIGMDRDGSVYGFNLKPHLDSDDGYSDNFVEWARSGKDKQHHVRLGVITGKDKPQWEKSLVFVGAVRKITSSVSTFKTVKYYGMDLQIPDNAMYVSVDMDRSVYSHFTKPEIKDNKRWWSCDGRKPDEEVDGGQSMFYVGPLDPAIKNIDWTSSCVFVE